MRIPDNVKIMGHEYKVTLCREPMLGRGTAGSCCANLLKIDLDTLVPESRQAEALLHEIIEALKYHLELNIGHPDLSALSEGLFNVFRNNRLDFSDGKS